MSFAQPPTVHLPNYDTRGDVPDEEPDYEAKHRRLLASDDTYRKVALALESLVELGSPHHRQLRELMAETMAEWDA